VLREVEKRIFHWRRRLGGVSEVRHRWIISLIVECRRESLLLLSNPHAEYGVWGTPLKNSAEGICQVKTMIIERISVRAILLTPERDVLLMRIRPPDGSDCFWITPGGGLEPGESIEVGLRRELREELGLAEFVMGPLVWRRQHTFNWGAKRICQREQYHIIPVSRFTPQMSDVIEGAYVDRFQWWHVTELTRACERLTPLSLAGIVTRYLDEGPPDGVLPVEVLVD